MENNEMVIPQYEEFATMNENGELVGEIGYKPVTAVLVTGIVGVVLIVLTRNLFGLCFGGLCIVMALWVHFAVKDHKVMNVYSDAVALFDVKDDSRVMRIPLTDISMYVVNKGNDNLIGLTLRNGSSIQAQSFQTGKSVKCLKKVLPGKSQEEITIKKNNERKAAGFSLSVFTKKK